MKKTNCALQAAQYATALDNRAIDEDWLALAQYPLLIMITLCTVSPFSYGVEMLSVFIMRILYVLTSLSHSAGMEGCLRGQGELRAPPSPRVETPPTHPPASRRIRIANPSLIPQSYWWTHLVTRTLFYHVNKVMKIGNGSHASVDNGFNPDQSSDFFGVQVLLPLDWIIVQSKKFFLPLLFRYAECGWVIQWSGCFKATSSEPLPSQYLSKWVISFTSWVEKLCQLQDGLEPTAHFL